jgi:hypothetical protein
MYVAGAVVALDYYVGWFWYVALALALSAAAGVISERL